MKENEKKEKKNIIIVTLIIVLLIIIGLATYFIMINNKNNEDEQIEQKILNSVDGQPVEYEYSIKNAAEKDGIKATNINFHVIGDQIEVVTTLKNNTWEKLNGYYIEIELLDKNNTVLSTIADNSTEVIEAGKSKEIVNYVMDIENKDKVSKARIVTLEKNNIEDAMNQTFDDMIPEEIKDMEQ